MIYLLPFRILRSLRLLSCLFVWIFVHVTLSVSNTAIAQERLASDPDPSRFISEIEAFRSWDSKNSTPNQALLFIGSSSFRMWKTADAFPDAPIINRGFGGAHLTDLAFFYEDIIRPYDPSLILVYIGDNDIAAGIDEELFLERYQEFTARIWQEYPEVRIGFVSIKPSSSRWMYWPEMNRVNERIREQAVGDSRHFYFDLASVLLNDKGLPDDTLFQSDLLHLNAEGYQRWTEELTRLLSEL